MSNYIINLIGTIQDRGKILQNTIIIIITSIKEIIILLYYIKFKILHKNTESIINYEILILLIFMTKCMPLLFISVSVAKYLHTVASF